MRWIWLSLLVLLFGMANALEVWRLESPTANRGQTPEKVKKINPMLHKYKLNLNFQRVAEFLTTGTHKRALRQQQEEETLLFELPQFGMQECTLFKSALFAPELEAKFPELVRRTGSCNNGTVQMFLNMDIYANTSFSATFTVPGTRADWFYVDNDNGLANRYVLYAKSGALQATESKQFSCGTTAVMVMPQNDTEEEQHGRRLQRDKFIGVTLRLAVAANRDYSKITGNTNRATLNAISTVMSRVNGIYTRELGVYFQLIANNDLLLCTKSNMNACSEMLPNHYADDVLGNAGNFMRKRGVSSSQYDIGHVFTTGSGGLAGLSVLCTQYKAMGTTGVKSPFGDGFSVDYVAHELGHQLNGQHSYQHCDKWGNMDASAWAAEPGSGSTIMAYAGICGKDNLQPHSDPYIHPVNLPTMHAFVHRQVSTVKNCGQVTEQQQGDDKRLAISTPRAGLTECTVPVGNYFTLTASIAAATAEAAPYFQWDQISTGVQALNNVQAAKFRSWKPRKSSTRYIPNLYVLSLGLQNKAPYSFAETLPRHPTTVWFRVLARTLYDTNSRTAQPTSEVWGDFDYRDTVVSFVNTVQPIKFAKDTAEMLRKGVKKGGSALKFKWNSGGAGARQIELLIAVNPMQKKISRNNFNADKNLKELAWVSLGVVSNNGTARVKLPTTLAKPGSTAKVSFMIRAVTDEFCSAFDFVRFARVKMPKRRALP